MLNTAQNHVTSNLSKLIIQTKYGGVPFLNDYLVSLFDFNLYNIKFSELLNYLDLFEKYNEHLNLKNIPNGEIIPSVNLNINHKLLGKYFKLPKIYLSFSEYSRLNSSDIGSNVDNIYFLNTNTGKCKVSSEEFLKYIKIFNPEICELPYELLPDDCGKKRVLRCYNKLKSFLDTLQEELKNDKAKRIEKNEDSPNLFQDTKFLMPIYLNHLDKFPIDFITEIIRKNQNLIQGFFIFYEDYKNLSSERIKNYRDILKTNILNQFQSADIILGCSTGHPIELMLSHQIGCNNFHIGYPFESAEKGLAIISNFLKSELVQSVNVVSLEGESIYDIARNKEIKLIDLNAKTFELDSEVIKPGCECFTCKNNYTRAYIHHLLKCKELNASILIAMHNLHFTANLYQNYISIEDDVRRVEYIRKFLDEECEEINTKNIV